MKDLGLAKRILGIEITRNRVGVVSYVNKGTS